MRWALPAPPIVTGFYRMLFASALLGAWLVLRRRAAPLPERGTALAVAAGACFGTDLALWNTAIVETSLANATFLVNTTPVYVGIFSVLALGERLGARFVIGAVLALVGTAILVDADWGRARAVRGDLLALAAALFYSGYLLLIKAVRHRAETLPALFAAGLGSTAVLGVYALVGGLPFSGFPSSSWLAFAGAAVVAQIVGVVGVVWALRYLRASFAAVALLGQPIGTALLGWVLVGEALSALQLAGCAAVGAGIGLASGSARDQENLRSSHQG